MTEIIAVTETIRDGMRHVEVITYGRQGPPGVGAGAAFIHQQTSPSDAWTIAHNLGLKPDVAVFDDGGNMIEAQVLHLDNNVTQIFFNSAITGTARCH